MCFRELKLFVIYLSYTILSTVLVFAEEFSTSFEFNDRSGAFILSESPQSISFENGESKSIGVPALYHTGRFAFMVDEGNVASIVFETPAAHISLYLRNQSSSVQSELKLLDVNGNELNAIIGESSQWTKVEFTSTDKAPPLGSITLANNGQSGYTVIDDLNYCALEDLPDNGKIEDPISEVINKSGPPIKLQMISSGLTAPNWGIFAPGNEEDLFVTDQDGVLWRINLESGNRSIFLDVRSQLVPLGIFGEGTFDERGLLGVAFHPDYQANGNVYTYTSEPVDGLVDFSTMPADSDADHHSVITEWHVESPMDPDAIVDMASRRVLLRIDQPQFNHNAGALNFGPDGMLYIAVGDGGGADDQDGQEFLGGVIIGHGSDGNGRDPTNPLGTVLRIDPKGTNSMNSQYGIPEDNPYQGHAQVLEEIFAYGFRNPFRFSFDTLSGLLFLGDVGQNDIEEINIVLPGGNYGWNYKEGTFNFNPNGTDPGFVTEEDPGVPLGLIDPIAQYDHDEGIAIVGGFVYRGTRIPWLYGRYVFGEFAKTFNNDGRLFFLKYRGSNPISEFQLSDQDDLGLSLLGFGQDSKGEIYVLANATGTPFGESGVVLRIEPVDRSFISYNDLSWKEGQIEDNITRYTTNNGAGTPPDGDSGLLIDHKTGEETDITLTVEGGLWNGDKHAGFGSLSDPGTDAYDVFNGHLDATGVLSYSELDVSLTLSGLNPDLYYNIVVFGNRGQSNYTDRLSETIIMGAESFVNRSSMDTSFEGEDDPSTVIVNGYNTQMGHVARFMQVQSGEDGEIKIIQSDGGSTNPPRFYLNAICVEAVEVSLENRIW